MIGTADRQAHYAKQIERCLAKAEAAGVRAHDVFEDWLLLVEATIERLPAHLKAAVSVGQMADDTPETAALWARMRDKYGHNDPDRCSWYFALFAQALGHLLQSTEDGYMDVLGQTYMQYAYPNPGAGQYFTPLPVASMMARIHGAEETKRHIYDQIWDIVKGNPDHPQSILAISGIMTSVLLEEEEPAENGRWFVERVAIPALQITDDDGKPLLQPETVHDPACGSGIMFLAHAASVPRWFHELGLVQYFGQDIDRTCVRMAQINMALYGLNAWGVKCALELTPDELAEIPKMLRRKYKKAQKAVANGDAERVQKIRADVARYKQTLKVALQRYRG